MKKILNKKLDEKAMLAGIFAFAALGFLYLYVAATVNNTEAPTKEIPQPQSTATTQDVQSSKSGMKKYRSNFLKVEFEYPEELKVNEKLNFGQLVDPNGKTVIEYGRSGSFYSNAREHVVDLSKKNNLILQNLQDVEGPYSGVTYEISIDGIREKAYFFAKDYAIYYFSTKDTSLFPDLETIAKSFKILE